MVDTSSATAGQGVSASVEASSIQSSFDSVKVIGEPARAYVESAPPSIVIDGAFGDWMGITSLDTDTAPVANSNVDIDAVGAGNDTESVYFYVSVKGDIFFGSFAPMKCSKPSGSGGGAPVELPRRTGEDITKVFVDTDGLAATGFSVSCEGKTLGADSLIEIKGLFGEIVLAARYTYVSGEWILMVGTVEAQNDDNQLELGVPASALDGAFDPDFIIQTTSWNTDGDYGLYDPSSLVASMQSWAVESPTTSSSATAMSYQRKLFYDGTNFWSFYYDGTNTVCKYSTNGGQTWTSRGSVFVGTGTEEASIWYDSVNNIVYAIGDSSSASTHVHVQRGVVNPAASTITWAGSDGNPTVSANSLGGKNTFISKDSSGYIWILSSALTQVSPARYDLRAFRSSGTDAITGWNSMGSMGCAAINPTLKGSILPAGSGSNMWVVYIFDGNISSKKYTGSWGSESRIYSVTGVAGYVDVAPPSALVDANGVIHVVYGDGHESPGGTVKPFIQYRYNNSNSWVGARLDSVGNSKGNRYPTLSLDTATGYLYAFWIQIDTMAIHCSRNVSGTWTELTLTGQTAYTKQYLTSVYSVAGEPNICWMWTQNITGTMEVQFDKQLPEFPGLAMPVLFFVALFVLARKKTRGRKANSL